MSCAKTNRQCTDIWGYELSTVLTGVEKDKHERLANIQKIHHTDLF